MYIIHIFYHIVQITPQERVIHSVLTYRTKNRQQLSFIPMYVHGEKNAIPTYGNYQLLLCHCLFKVCTCFYHIVQIKCNRFDLLSYREIDVITSFQCAVYKLHIAIIKSVDTAV